jgi:hypothetical protein
LRTLCLYGGPDARTTRWRDRHYGIYRRRVEAYDANDITIGSSRISRRTWSADRAGREKRVEE